MSFSTSRPSSTPKLPFRIVVLAPFSGSATSSGSDSGDAATALHRVDGSNLDELLATVGGPLELAAAGPQSAGSTTQAAPGRLSLRFENMKAMRPEGIARQLPGGAARLEARQILNQLKMRKITTEAALAALARLNLPGDLGQQITAALSGAGRVEAPGRRVETAPQPVAGEDPHRVEPSAGPAPDDADPLGGLLSMVDVPGEPTTEPRRGADTPGKPPQAPPPDPAAAAISAVIGSMAGGGAGKAAAGGARDAGSPAAAQAALELLDRDIASGVEAVLDHPDFRKFEAAWRGLRFLISRIDFREGITLEIRGTSAQRFTDALAEIAAEKAAGTLAGDPISLLVGGFTLPLDEDSLQSLTIAGAAAEVIGAPFLTGIDMTSAGSFARDPAWTAFRREPSSEWLGLAVNPFLLRLPFGGETDPVKEFAFSERQDASVWGSPALVVGAAAARSFARYGWPTFLEGRDEAMEDFPVAPSSSGQIPTAHLIGPDQASNWADSGFIPLVCPPNHDAIFIVRAPSAVPGRSIPHKLAERRLTDLLSGPLAAAGDPRDTEKFGAAIRKAMARIGVDSLDFEIAVAPDAASTGVLEVRVRFRPGPPVLKSPQDIELHFAFGA